MSRTILLAVVGALVAGAALAVGGLFALGVITFGAAKEETTTASSATKADQDYASKNGTEHNRRGGESRRTSRYGR